MIDLTQLVETLKEQLRQIDPQEFPELSLSVFGALINAEDARRGRPQHDRREAVIAESLCHWRQDRGDARRQTHEAFHFGDHPGQTGACPYEIVAAVLRGQPDPRLAV